VFRFSLFREIFLDKMSIIGCPYGREIGEKKPWEYMPDTLDERKRTLKDDDVEFVLSCQKGNIDAFAVLVERHQKKMLNIAYRLMGNYEDACDVVQEAFLSAYRSIRKFRGESRFATWIYRIVVNHTKNRLHQMRARSRHEESSIDDPVAMEGGNPLRPAATPESSPVELLEQKEREAKVQKCINSLADEYREVLVLRDIQEFSYDEIRDILNIPDGTVKSRLFRARTALKECLTKVIGDL